MATKAKKARPRKGHSRLTRELLETAQDMHASGLMTKAARDKITMRHLGAAVSSNPPAKHFRTKRFLGATLPGCRQNAKRLYRLDGAGTYSANGA
jgi:putative transcriptional regulator